MTNLELVISQNPILNQYYEEFEKTQDSSDLLQGLRALVNGEADESSDSDKDDNSNKKILDQVGFNNKFRCPPQEMLL